MGNRQLEDVQRVFVKLQTQFSERILSKSQLGIGVMRPTRKQLAAIRVSARERRQTEAVVRNSSGMSTEAITERLPGVSLYALTNAADEFLLASGVRTRKSIGLFCFQEEDAEALLEQMNAMIPGMRSGSKVVPVPLNKVFQLKLDGVAFRLVPESSQVKHALKEKQKAGESDKEICGVPVF